MLWRRRSWLSRALYHSLQPMTRPVPTSVKQPSSFQRAEPLISANAPRTRRKNRHAEDQPPRPHSSTHPKCYSSCFSFRSTSPPIRRRQIGSLPRCRKLECIIDNIIIIQTATHAHKNSSSSTIVILFYCVSFSLLESFSLPIGVLSTARWQPLHDELITADQHLKTFFRVLFLIAFSFMHTRNVTARKAFPSFVTSIAALIAICTQSKYSSSAESSPQRNARSLFFWALTAHTNFASSLWVTATKYVARHRI